MKTKLFLPALLTVSLLLSACDKDDESKDGTLSFRTTVWNAENPDDKGQFNNEKGDTNTVDIINTLHVLYKIEITTDNINQDASSDDINWILMYESSDEMLATERSITIEVPAGKYNGFKISQRNKMYWRCIYEGDTVNFPSFNNSDLGPDARLVNIFGKDGLYEADNGSFVLINDRERLGTFEVLEDAVTNVTMRMNLKTLDWIDNDYSGDWSDGDQLKNWTVPDGITTMTDFIVEYE